MGRPFKSPQEHEEDGQTDKRYLRSPPKADGLPAKPRGLDAIASKHWDTYVPKLHKLGVATEVDAPALELMCRAWGTYQRNVIVLEEDTNPGSMEAKRKQGMVNDAAKAYDSLSSKFGMNPLARNGVNVKASITADRGERYKQG